MRRYNQQIEDAYASSKRQGDLMRAREIERSSGQDRRNRYRDDRYEFPARHRPFDRDDRGETERTDRYGYERSAMRNSDMVRRGQSGERRDNYPDTYRSAEAGYVSVFVGDDLGRRNEMPGIMRRAEQGLHRGKGPRNYKRSDDRIREDVMDRLTDDAFVDASDIEVTVQGSEVTLAGTVIDRAEKRRVEDVIESISGVTNVENRLKIRSRWERSDQQRSETEIRATSTT
ncbi:BON domain-containing protein [Fulvivirgaceae bacterium PWU4]|uniref:BON domain-containing protein n=1 Tax=Chryseosolibacter histidini TaxID=2782349 RepID=A0AAP2DGP8_9BACT|nr:BON domain-containing protein [Chryseosolibacter histidini]MBT1695876.1 BON domain-containing protein [Chryseosolibacter histidini]